MDNKGITTNEKASLGTEELRNDATLIYDVHHCVASIIFGSTSTLFLG